MDARIEALSIIHAEHQSMGAVIGALKHVAEEVAQGKLRPDYKLLWSILYYIEEFPETQHHPKEDQVLFPAVRARSHEIDAVLHELGRQHASSRPHLERLKSLLGRMQAEVPGATQAFAEQVASYAAFHFRHMHEEESVVLPKASEVLTAQDWEGVAASFRQNDDPLRAQGASGSDWFRALYTRIVALVPEPWGVGARR